MTPNQLEKIITGPTDHLVRPITHSDYKKFEALEKLAPLFLELWEKATYVSEFSHSPFYKGNISELTEVLKKLGDAE